jgi:predicted RNase H-like nuclease (RuvC/YqgF family)
MVDLHTSMLFLPVQAYPVQEYLVELHPLVEAYLVQVCQKQDYQVELRFHLQKQVPLSQHRSSQENTEELNEAQTNYVTALKTLTETIGKVQEQCEHLTSNSDEMKNLNRTLTGISTVYEMQLKGASKQIGTIDQINDQTRRMAEQIEQLNRIYARMIEAMTVNMRAQTPGAAPQI